VTYMTCAKCGDYLDARVRPGYVPTIYGCEPRHGWRIVVLCAKCWQSEPESQPAAAAKEGKP